MILCWSWSCSFVLIRLDQQKLVVLLWVSRSGNIFDSRECLSFENQTLLSSSCEHSVIEKYGSLTIFQTLGWVFKKNLCIYCTFKTYYTCCHISASRTKCDSSMEQLVLTMSDTCSILVELPIIYAAEKCLNL